MYKIVGADQKEYGPVSAEQVSQWIAEGRANGQTLVRFEEGPWKPLSTFPEFAPNLATAAPPPLAGAGPSPTGFAGVRKTNSLAVAGLILSVLGLLQCCAPLFAILALIISGIACRQIHRDPATQSGRGIAWAGVIVSAAGLVLFVILWTTGFFHDLLRNLPNFR